MAHNCREHPHEVAEGMCRSCGASFCADCLIYAFGPAKPPFCVPCAITAGGVRKGARNPSVVVEKEKKARLKEWRKARKRDLDSPPPDGVATWQRMDEAAVADEEAAGEARAAAEREALRLPPPEPETPTPPPDVNLAPPGPPGADWRDEIDTEAAANFGPPGSSYDGQAADFAEEVPGAPLLGYADLDEPVAYPPAPLNEPLEPVAAYEPAAALPEVVPFEPTPLAAEPLPPYEPTTVESPTYAPEPFEPTPLGSEAAVTMDMGGDPLAASFGTAAPDPLVAFGLDGGETSFAPAPSYDPLPPPPQDAQPLPSPPATTPPASSPPPSDGVRSGIRPHTPTRIPAAGERPKASDAKALLDRIAALRSDSDD